MDIDYTLMPMVFVAIALAVDALCIRYLTAMSRRNLSLTGRAIRCVLPCAAMGLATVAGASSAYNVVATRLYWAQHAPGGRVENVNGYRMYIDCTGSGSPTLVLDAGLGADSVAWNQLQPALSRTTRVCSYDRPGFGESQVVPGPQDADAIAGELHQLLKKAGVTGPLVLMGHSMAGLYIRDYAERYPAEVAGLIFVDASTPFQFRNPAFHRSGRPPLWIPRLAMMAGVPRLIGMCTYRGNGPDAALVRERKEDVCRIHYEALAGELLAFDRSSSEDEPKQSFGALPILIFSHDPLGPLPRKQQTKEQQAQQRAWNEMQEGLKSLSTRSRRIVVLGATHEIFEEQPALVERDVVEFLGQIRGTAAQPTDYGTTTTE